MKSEKFADIYLDFINNFLTYEKFAEYYGYSIMQASLILAIAKVLHDERAERNKQALKPFEPVMIKEETEPYHQEIIEPENKVSADVLQAVLNSDEPYYENTVIALINDLENQDKGRVIFTVEQKNSDKHCTYKVTKTDFAEGALVVSLLTGSNNENDYTSFGFIDPVTKEVRLWNRFKYSDAYKKWGEIFRNALFGAEDLKISHSGRCFKCGRTLTTPESIQSGIGPVCAAM